MRSWNLDKFVEQYGWYKAHQIWGKSRQAIFKAIDSNRSIKVIELETGYEIHESKMLGCVELGVVNLDHQNRNGGRPRG